MFLSCSRLPLDQLSMSLPFDVGTFKDAPCLETALFPLLSSWGRPWYLSAVMHIEYTTYTPSIDSVSNLYHIDYHSSLCKLSIQHASFVQTIF